MYEIDRGLPLLGCTLDENGANFGIHLEQDLKINLEIYFSYMDEHPFIEILLDKKEHMTEDIYHVYVKDVKEDMAYCYRLEDENTGQKYVIFDPYALSIREFPEGSNSYKGIIIKKENIVYHKPNIPWEKTVIYEMHVGAFTRQDFDNPNKACRGTIRGLIEKIPYLKDLGVTAVELMPVFKWNPYTLHTFHPETGEKLKDYWGYNPIGFFALDSKYSSNQRIKGEITEFKELIQKFHENGMEVILDVVYNHTGEGAENGDIFNFKVQGASTYYKIDELGRYMNCSGTGNTLNTQNKMVKKLIMDSLKYWVLYMGVDGFRFDLASILGQDHRGRWITPSLLDEIATDPILASVKLIAESWDAKGSYDVGKMPYPFAEWSDIFRDTIRKFIRGDLGLTKALADCILGKEVYFTDIRKSMNHTIHYVTAHDGFTMWDLTSYNEKHNLDNGEDNRDGSNVNYSDNCGEEGETDDIYIINKRKKRVKNYMSLLLLSRGVPMILMGDEMCRTQNGNNNAYCQDNETMWVDWTRLEKNQDIYRFLKFLIKLRKEIKFISGIPLEDNISWHGVHYGKPDWSYYSRSLAWHIEGDKEHYYMVINSYHEALDFELPPIKTEWLRIIDTNKEYPDDIIYEGEKVTAITYKVHPFSFCLFKSKEK